MFITLRFGDDNKLLVNPNCAAKNMLDFIREKCECDKNVLVDLCDESGSVKYLHEQPEMDIVIDIFENKAIYIPIVVERNEDQTVKKFVPLLESFSTVYPGLKKKLREQCPSNEGEKTVHMRLENISVSSKGKGNKSLVDMNKGSKSRASGTKKKS